MLILSFRLGMPIEVRRRQAGQGREGKLRHSLNRLFQVGRNPGTSMSKPLSRRSRDFFAGIPHIYSASSGSERQESTYEPAPVSLTRSWGLSPQERSPVK
jgi:hypothetical protein